MFCAGWYEPYARTQALYAQEYERLYLFDKKARDITTHISYQSLHFPNIFFLSFACPNSSFRLDVADLLCSYFRDESHFIVIIFYQIWIIFGVDIFFLSFWFLVLKSPDDNQKLFPQQITRQNQNGGFFPYPRRHKKTEFVNVKKNVSDGNITSKMLYDTHILKIFNHYNNFKRTWTRSTIIYSFLLFFFIPHMICA